MTMEESIKILVYQHTYGNMEEAVRQALAMAIKALQDRPSGKWIIKQGNYCGVMIKEFYCDQCMTRGALRRVYSDPEPLPNFCSYCGADMRGGQDET